MKVYAERPLRVLGQMLGDLLLIGWVGAWIWLGLQFHDRLDALRRPTMQVGQASGNLADSLSDTGEQLRGLQLVGELLAAPFDAIVGSARQLVDASDSSQQAIARLADLSFVVISLFPIILAVTVWAVLRGRWMRHATAAARLRNSGHGDGLLAVQALATARLDHVVRLASPGNPLDDPISRHRLASYQLRRLGLRSYEPR
jgi:hypothetical protein